jgi:hypothetical protein
VRGQRRVTDGRRDDRVRLVAAKTFPVSLIVVCQVELSQSAARARGPERETRPAKWQLQSANTSYFTRSLCHHCHYCNCVRVTQRISSILCRRHLSHYFQYKVVCISKGPLISSSYRMHLESGTLRSIPYSCLRLPYESLCPLLLASPT